MEFCDLKPWEDRRLMVSGVWVLEGCAMGVGGVEGGGGVWGDGGCVGGGGCAEERGGGVGGGEE